MLAHLGCCGQNVVRRVGNGFIVVHPSLHMVRRTVHNQYAKEVGFYCTKTQYFVDNLPAVRQLGR